MLCFLILFPYYRNHFPMFWGTILLIWRIMKNFYFWSHFHTNLYGKIITNEFNLFCSWARPMSVFQIHFSQKYANIYSTDEWVVFTAVFQLQYCYEYGNWNSFKNRSKWASTEIYLGWLLAKCLWRSYL